MWADDMTGNKEFTIGGLSLMCIVKNKLHVVSGNNNSVLFNNETGQHIIINY